MAASITNLYRICCELDARAAKLESGSIETANVLNHHLGEIYNQFNTEVEGSTW